jgi:hypothetical protein
MDGSTSPDIDDTIVDKGGAWVNDLPYSEVRAGGLSTFSYATVLLDNKDKWIGTWKLEDDERGYLRLDPVPTASTVRFSDNEFYDDSLAAIENGAIVAKPSEIYHTFVSEFDLPQNKNLYMRNVFPKEGEVALTSENGRPVIFRGINQKDMLSFLEKGVLSNYQQESSGAKIFDPSDNYFADNPSAFQYAVEAQSYGVPTFESPAYVIVMEKPKENIREIPEAHEVVVQRPVKLEEIKTIYEIRPFKIKSGNVEMWKDDTARVTRMSEGKLEALYQAPQVECVFRKIDVDVLKRKS